MYFTLHKIYDIQRYTSVLYLKHWVKLLHDRTGNSRSEQFAAKSHRGRDIVVSAEIQIIQNVKFSIEL